MTQCSDAAIRFQGLGSRAVLASFDGGKVTSDAGALLLREVEGRFGFLDRFAACFTDHRDPGRVTHPLRDLLAQRVYGLCLGYEDLNDHERLRLDPLLAVLVGKDDPIGDGRTPVLAGKSTLNRLELTGAGASESSRYKKTVAHLGQIEGFLVDSFVRQQAKPPERLVLDLDATDDPLHGHQLGRFFHGYYDGYCYLPLYIFCGDHPLCALLRPSDIDASKGSLEKVIAIVARLRAAWPGVKVLLRADGGFCREPIMRWCEANGVDFLFGLAKNARLKRILGKEMHEAKEEFAATGLPARRFKDFEYRTKTSWSRARRVVGKAEHIGGDKANPRFVVTSLPESEYGAKPLYEQEYCGRGDMENRIKEQQLSLFADCLCCESMRANQVRLLLSTVAYALMRSLREFGLAGTEMAAAQAGTIRSRLFKIGAVVRVSVRRVTVAMSEGYPWAELFARVADNLRSWRNPAAVPAPEG